MSGLLHSTKKTRKRKFLGEMEGVVPWKALVQIVEPHHPKARTGQPPVGIEIMLRIHYLQQWFALSEPAMEEALRDMPVLREFARLDNAPRATDILRVVNDLLQAKGLMMKNGTLVGATLIAAPSSTKNASGERDPENGARYRAR